MSALMLSDQNTLNDINPFVVGGPGARRKPFGFAPAAKTNDPITCDTYGCSINTQPDDPWEPKGENAECMAGIFAHDSSRLGLYQGCVPPKNPVSCPIDRALEPTQEFLPDLYTLIPYKDPVPKQLQDTKVSDVMTKVSFPVFIVILVILLLMLAKR